MTGRENFSIPENLPQLRSDLTPLYDLKPEDYNQIVNELTNLLVVAIYLIRQTGNENLAQTIVFRSTEILLNYDDDTAEFVKRSSISQK